MFGPVSPVPDLWPLSIAEHGPRDHMYTLSKSSDYKDALPKLSRSV